MARSAPHHRRPCKGKPMPPCSATRLSVAAGAENVGLHILLRPRAQLRDNLLYSAIAASEAHATTARRRGKKKLEYAKRSQLPPTRAPTKRHPQQKAPRSEGKVAQREAAGQEFAAPLRLEVRIGQPPSSARRATQLAGDLSSALTIRPLGHTRNGSYIAIGRTSYMLCSKKLERLPHFWKACIVSSCLPLLHTGGLCSWSDAALR